VPSRTVALLNYVDGDYSDPATYVCNLRGCLGLAPVPNHPLFHTAEPVRERVQGPLEGRLRGQRARHRREPFGRDLDNTELALDENSAGSILEQSNLPHLSLPGQEGVAELLYFVALPYLFSAHVESTNVNDVQITMGRELRAFTRAVGAFYEEVGAHTRCRSESPPAGHLPAAMDRRWVTSRRRCNR